MLTRLRTAIVAMALVGVPGLAAAEERLFYNTETSATTHRHETLLDLASAQSYHDFASGTGSDTDVALSVQYGVTKEWDILVHWLFMQSTGDMARGTSAEAFHVHAMELHTRYRLEERGKWPLDVVLAGHVMHALADNMWTLEPELIFSRRVDEWTFAANAGVPVQFGGALTGAQAWTDWKAGIAINFTKKSTLGVEDWGSFGWSDLAGTATNYVGPSLSWAPTKGMHFATTFGFGAGGISDAWNMGALFLLKL